MSLRKNNTVRSCRPDEMAVIGDIINDAAKAYKGVIPADCWREPYLSPAELKRDVDSGVSFWGLEQHGKLVGVMGIQPVQDVVLIRHAYVRTENRHQGIGGQLLAYLSSLAPGAILVGTWAAATWATAFYEKYGFRRVIPTEKNRLLKQYWSIPQRQIEASVVLADQNWFQKA